LGMCWLQIWLFSKLVSYVLVRVYAPC
jgi:hypothetical protein